MNRSYVGLGANLGERLASLRAAVAALAALPRTRVSALSPVYETEPVGAPPPAYLNAAVALETDLDPRELLEALLGIEARLGRARTVPGAPRTIDLDLLLHGDSVTATDRLVLPHPRLRGRRFVLEPLLAIAPSLRDPATGEPLARALAWLPPQGVVLTSLDLRAYPA
jgi:2-amino-4-hydroxy-6-hydroxymethyldihydropteridine diphosphokinase